MILYIALGFLGCGFAIWVTWLMLWAFLFQPLFKDTKASVLQHGWQPKRKRTQRSYLSKRLTKG